MVAMPHTATSPFAIPRTRGVIPTAAGLLVAGALFVIYPALRPFSDEVSLEGARAFASTQWVWAHTAAMIGFLVLSLSLFGVAVRLRGTRGEAAARWGAILGAVGIGLTLPYYGAEVFGLHAVGQAVVERGDVSLMSITDSIRWEAGCGPRRLKAAPSPPSTSPAPAYTLLMCGCASPVPCWTS